MIIKFLLQKSCTNREKNPLKRLFKDFKLCVLEAGDAWRWSLGWYIHNKKVEVEGGKRERFLGEGLL